MKRDMDLIRQIAMETEKMKYGFGLTGLPNVSSEDFANHCKLMEEAGLINARITEFQDMGPPNAAVHRLTWAGHDFLDAARSDTVWAKAKETVLKPGMSFTFDVLKEWLKTEITQGFPTLRG